MLIGSASAQSTDPAVLTLDTVLNQIRQASAWQQADLNLQSAQRGLDTARASTKLTLSLNGSLNAAATPTPAIGTTNLTPTVGATVSTSVLPWGSSQDAIRSAERNLLTAQSQRATTQSNLLLTVQQQYFAARLAEFDVLLAQRSVELRTRQLDAATAQRELGNATTSTTLTRTADLQAALATLLRAQQALQQANFQLSSTLGVSLGNVTFGTAPRDPGEPASLDGLLTTALTARSEVIAAQQAVLAAQDTLANARRDRGLPDLTANVRYSEAGGSGTNLNGSLNFETGMFNSTLSSGLSGGTGSVSVGVSASFTLFDPAGDARIASAETQLASAQLALTLALRNVELDVRQKYASLVNARQALLTSAALVASAQNSLSTTEAQFEAGRVTALDVQNARLTLQSAQRDRESALQTAQLAAEVLRHATTPAQGGPA